MVLLERPLHARESLEGTTSCSKRCQTSLPLSTWPSSSLPSCLCGVVVWRSEMKSCVHFLRRCLLMPAVPLHVAQCTAAHKPMSHSLNTITTITTTESSSCLRRPSLGCLPGASPLHRLFSLRVRGCMRLSLQLVLLVVTIVASIVPSAAAFRIDSMISKFIGKHLPDYTYSVPGKKLLEPPPPFLPDGSALLLLLPRASTIPHPPTRIQPHSIA